MKQKASSSKKILWLLGIGVLFIFMATACAKLYRLYSLKSKMKGYQAKIKALETCNQELQEDINASHDPIWLELALMEELGVIPKDAIKINYQEDE
jgi:hypothetical protein